MKCLLCGLLCLCTSWCMGQKHDYMWLFGYDSYTSFPEFGGITIDFNHSPVSITKTERPMNFLATNSSMCDSSGNLLFYTNGAYFADRFDNMMPNGDSINTDYQMPGDPDGYLLNQAAITLPLPDTSNIYYIFHLSFELVPTPLGYNTSLQYSVVDMTLNNGLGDVVKKNQVVIDGGLIGQSYLTACKHANGKDWWIVIPAQESDAYHTILFTGKGIVSDSMQNAGEVIPLKLDGAGQSAFSPDGKTYVYYNTNVDLYKFDFNRCNGALSNFQHIPIEDTCSIWHCQSGFAISPNSRYGYASVTQYLYQIDLLTGEVVKIADYDGFHDTIVGKPTGFYLAQLAPDGKIYLSCPSSTPFMHVINEPDELGLACDFVQHGISLPTLNAYGLPHFPNYRLGPVSANSCDSLATLSSEPRLFSGFEIHPNPASIELKISLPASNDYNQFQLKITNLLGQPLLSKPFTGSQTTVDVSKLPLGPIFVQILESGQIRAVGRAVILR